MKKSKKSDLGDRIKALRTSKKLRRADVAKKADISYDYLAKIENNKRSPSIDLLSQVLRALGTTVDDFFGSKPAKKPPARDRGKAKTKREDLPIEEWGLVRLGEARGVPVAGWTQAGAWTTAIEDLQSDEAVWSDSVPEGCFALVVEGDSMEPEFSPGDVVVVDPNAQPKSGDYVVARLEGEDQATFKQFLKKKGKVVLKALNSTYPNLLLKGPYDTVLVGVVVEAKKIFTKPDRSAQIMAELVAWLSELPEYDLEEVLKMLIPGASV